MRISVFATAVGVCLGFGGSALGSVSSIGPFSGTHSEGFEGFAYGNIAGGVPGTSGPVSVLGGQGTMSGQHITTQTPLYIWGSIGGFSLGTNGTAVPFDGLKGVHLQTGSGNTIPTGRFDFLNPVSEFGGYWVHARFGNLGLSTTIRLYDEDDNLLHTQIYTYNSALGGVSEWLGWTSTTPIGAVEFTGYYMGVDGVQINVPAPGVTAVIGCAGVGAARRRRR
jgi:hypothetical protein